MPLYSIITVTYNNLSGLRRTHESLRAQTCGDYEWIVIDGGSQDGTGAYMKSCSSVILSVSEGSGKLAGDPSPPAFAKATAGKAAQDDKIKFISEPDDGIYDAMNKGINRATGDYLLFLNAGDALATPDVLETLSKQTAADFIYGDALEEVDDGMKGLRDDGKRECFSSSHHLPIASSRYKPARSHTEILRGMITHHQAMLYRRAAVGVLRYDTSLAIAADYKFTLQFLQQAGNAYYVPFPVCVFERGGVSQQNVRLGRKEQYLVRREMRACGVLQNRQIYIKQMAASLLKRALPFMYWRLRG